LNYLYLYFESYFCFVSSVRSQSWDPSSYRVPPLHNHILDPPAHPNRTHNAPHNLSLVSSITSLSSAHFRLPICVSLANNLFTAITIQRTPFTVRQARSIIFRSSTILYRQKYQHLLAAILHPLRDHLNPPKRQPLSDPSTTPHPDHYYNGSLKGWSHFGTISLL